MYSHSTGASSSTEEAQLHVILRIILSGVQSGQSGASSLYQLQGAQTQAPIQFC